MSTHEPKHPRAGEPPFLPIRWVTPLLLMGLACSTDSAPPAEDPGIIRSTAYNELDPEAYEQAHCRELLPGLFTHQCYGLNSWLALHARVRRNLANVEMDLAKLARAQGRLDEAEDRARRALEINLATQGPPADVIRQFTTAPSGPVPDTRPLEARIETALADGWCGPSLILLTELDPSWALRIEGGEDPSHGAEPCASLLQLRRAQAHALAREEAEARTEAQRAAERMVEQLVVTLDATQPAEPMPPPPLSWDWAPLSYPTAELGFHWGWPHMEDQLELLAAQAARAAELAGDPVSSQGVEQTATRLTRLRELRDDLPELGLRWTTAEALGRVPT